MKKFDKITLRMKIILFAVVVIVTACNTGTKTGAQNLTPEEAKNLAKEAWLFGMPLVMFEKRIDYSTHVTQPEETRSPINQFVHYRKFVDASNRSIVGFNVDNLYSLAWIASADKEANWLPAPKSGAFKIALRLYAPTEKVIDGSWVPPGIIPQK